MFRRLSRWFARNLGPIATTEELGTLKMLETIERCKIAENRQRLAKRMARVANDEDTLVELVAVETAVDHLVRLELMRAQNRYEYGDFDPYFDACNLLWKKMDRQERERALAMMHNSDPRLL